MAKNYDEINFWEDEIEAIMESMGLSHKTGHPTDVWEARRECPGDLDDLDLYPED